MVFTNTGRLGDFFCMLPIISWWHKQNPDKEIHIVLSDNIQFVQSAIDICKIIPFIKTVSICGHKVFDFTGGQPYQFNPNDYGFPCDEYINIGYRHHPNKFIPQFLAEEHGLGVDLDFFINLPDSDIDYSDKIVYSLGGKERKSSYQLKFPQEKYIELNPSNSIIDNLIICKQAKRVYTAPHGFSIALNLCGIESVVFCKHNPFAVNYYLPNHGTLLNMTDDNWII